MNILIPIKLSNYNSSSVFNEQESADNNTPLNLAVRKFFKNDKLLGTPEYIISMSVKTEDTVMPEYVFQKEVLNNLEAGVSLLESASIAKNVNLKNMSNLYSEIDFLTDKTFYKDNPNADPNTVLRVLEYEIVNPQHLFTDSNTIEGFLTVLVGVMEFLIPLYSPQEIMGMIPKNLDDKEAQKIIITSYNLILKGVDSKKVYNEFIKLKNYKKCQKHQVNKKFGLSKSGLNL